MPKPTLDDLTRAGKTARAAEQRGREDEVNRQLGALDSTARRSTSPLGVLAGSGALFLLMCIGVPTLIMVVFGLVEPISRHGTYSHENPAVWIGHVGLAITGSFLAVIVAARLHVPSALRAEDAWLKALPFALVNHTKLLGNYRSFFTIEFTAASPSRDLFVLALDGASSPTDRLEAGDRDDGPFAVEVTCPVTGTARARWRTLRRLVETLLVPLHDKFPITTVRFR